MPPTLNRRSVTGAFLALTLALSACGQTPPVAPSAAPAPVSSAPASSPLPLTDAGQANEARTTAVAAARGLKVNALVTLEDGAGVPTTYIDAATPGGQPVTLIGSVEGGTPVFAELGMVLEGQAGTRGSPFVITPLTAQGAVSTAMTAQGVADWVYDRLVSLINQYKRAPGWLKWTLRGPIKAVIKLIIGEAINRGCNYAYDTLVRKLHADSRWVPLGRALLCEILLG